MGRLFNYAALFSGILAVAVVIAWLLAGWVNPRRHHLSLNKGCYLSIDARDMDARLEVFNDDVYGPYKGSILGLAEDPNPPTVSGFGDTMGIYYRHIQWPQGGILWTLSLSLAYPLLVTLILPAIWLVKHFWQKFRGNESPPARV